MSIVAEKTAELMVPTGKVIASFPWDNKWAYGSWLAQTYYMVNYSTRLVALAGSYAEIEKEAIHRRFVDHSIEERGHPEIAIADLRTLGFKLQDFSRTYQADAMYQIQYYWIQHRGATSFFGYTLALETIAQKFGVGIYETVKAKHGPKASNFIRIHSIDDQDHVASAYEQINKLSKQETELVLENLKMSCEIYRSMLTQIQSDLSEKDL